MTNFQAVTIRMPENLHLRLKLQAVSERRSMQEIFLELASTYVGATEGTSQASHTTLRDRQRAATSEPTSEKNFHPDFGKKLKK